MSDDLDKADGWRRGDVARIDGPWVRRVCRWSWQTHVVHEVVSEDARGKLWTYKVEDWWTRPLRWLAVLAARRRVRQLERRMARQQAERTTEWQEVR